MSKNVSRIQSVEDARLLAKRRVPKGIYQMFEAGSGSNVTMQRNTEVFQEVLFRPRGAVFHPERDLSTTVLGHRISMPAIVSSVGFLKTGHRDGEAGVARAAGAAGTIQFVSGVTSTPIEEIMAAATGPVFYQLYYVGGREASAPIIQRAKAAGVKGLVLTVDTPTIARPRDLPYTERAGVPLGVTLRDAIRFLPQLVTKPAWTWDLIREGIREPQVAMGLRPDGTPMGLFEGISHIYEQTPDVGGSAVDSQALGRADRRQGHPHGGGRAPRGGRGRGCHRGLQPRRQRARRQRSRRSGCCPRSSTPWATRSRCSWTAECVAGRTSSRRSRSARARCCSGVPTSIHCSRRGSLACAASSSCSVSRSTRGSPSSARGQFTSSTRRSWRSRPTGRPAPISAANRLLNGPIPHLGRTTGGLTGARASRCRPRRARTRGAEQ